MVSGGGRWGVVGPGPGRLWVVAGGSWVFGDVDGRWYLVCGELYVVCGQGEEASDDNRV
jgi:hypothetical protein